MRILQVMASRANGGAETYSADMMASLHAAGVEQVAVVPRASIHHDRLAAAGVRLAADVLDARLGLLRRRKLAALIEAFRPDLVHCWMRRAASLVPKLDVPVIGWFGGYYEPANFPRCSHFVGVTPAIVEHMVERGVPKARAHYVPTFPTIESAAPVARADLATPADATVLLTLSRLHEKKGLDVLLQALAELPACVAWIAGDGPLGGGLEGAWPPGSASPIACGSWAGATTAGRCCAPPTSACCPRAGSPSAPSCWRPGPPERRWWRRRARVRRP